MIDNSDCPYCGVAMVRVENHGHCRSVEHFIPNTLLSVPRSPRDGDFYACRTCNSTKSKIDYVLAVVTRAQSARTEVAVDTMVRAVTSSKKSSQKFVEMVKGARSAPDGVHMTMPMNGRDLLDYLHFLAKGQFFMKTDKIFDGNDFVILADFISKKVFQAFQAAYKIQHWSNPVQDLTENPHADTCGSDECVVWSADNEYLFVFHNFVGVTIQILPRSRSNYLRARKAEGKLLRAFNSKGSH